MEDSKTKIDTFLQILKAEMIAEYLDTIDRDYIKTVVKRAGGKVTDVDKILQHPEVKEIDEDQFYIKTREQN